MPRFKPTFHFPSWSSEGTCSLCFLGTDHEPDGQRVRFRQISCRSAQPNPPAVLEGEEIRVVGQWRSLVPVPVPPRVAGIQAENLNCVLNKTYADSFPSRFRDLKIIKIHKFLLPFLQATFILNKNTFFFSRKQNTSIKDEFSKQPGKYLQKFPKMCWYNQDGEML